MLALGIVSVLPRASIAQHLRGLADIFCCSVEELSPGETLVTVPCTQSVGIVLESNVLGHGAEGNQGVAKSVLPKVVRWPMLLPGLEALSDCVGEVGIVLLGATHVACSGWDVVDGCVDSRSHEVVLILDVNYLWSVGNLSSISIVLFTYESNWRICSKMSSESSNVEWSP